MDREIARYVIRNFDRLSGLVGPNICRNIVRRFLPKNRLYKEVSGSAIVPEIYGTRKQACILVEICGNS